MGYEAIFHYHPAKETGGYDYDVREKFTKKIGKMDDVPIEKINSLVMKQLARRDIMVFDVEIYEFVRRKVQFKITKTGVSIKNKKVEWDGNDDSMEVESIDDLIEAPVFKMVNQETVNAPMTLPPKTQPLPIRFEYFTADKIVLSGLNRSGKFFTYNKRYPIFEERVSPRQAAITNQYTPYGNSGIEPIEYRTVDDTGKECWTVSLYFEMENSAYDPNEGIQSNPADQVVLRRN